MDHKIDFKIFAFVEINACCIFLKNKVPEHLVAQNVSKMGVSYADPRKRDSRTLFRI
jgi:hypothetical protein